jgi:DNA-directed RNA polymerase sigma subunit (sigma70/sigma32)
MRVNIPLANQNVTPSEESATAQSAVRRVDGPKPPDSSAHTPSNELEQFLSSLRDFPELRQEVIQEVARRLAGGELTTPQSLDQTVQAILRTLRS